jgi:hypothetical protein
VSDQLRFIEGRSKLALLITISVVLAGATLIAALSVYFWKFHSGLSIDPAHWGQFGDFVGGTVNPIMGFLTIIALALTLILQSRQLSISSRELALSREELQLTRQELSRSAHAQELSEKALRAQATTAERSAKLTATNFLLEQYEAELHRFRERGFIPAERAPRYTLVQKRTAVLTEMIDTLFVEVAGDDDDRV